MPTIQNPHDHDLFVVELHKILAPKEIVQVTKVLADKLRRSGVLKVEGDAPEAVREVTTRGSKSVEQTGAPKLETR